MSSNLSESDKYCFELLLKTQKAVADMAIAQSAYEALLNSPNIGNQWEKTRRFVAKKADEFREFWARVYTEEEYEDLEMKGAEYAAYIAEANEDKETMKGAESEEQVQEKSGDTTKTQRQPSSDKIFNLLVESQDALRAMAVVVSTYEALLTSSELANQKPIGQVRALAKWERTRRFAAEKSREYRVFCAPVYTVEELEVLKMVDAEYAVEVERNGQVLRETQKNEGDKRADDEEQVQREKREEKVIGDSDDRKEQKTSGETKKAKRVKSCAKLSQILTTLETHKEDTDDRLENLMKSIKISEDQKMASIQKDLRIQQLEQELEAKNRENQQLKAAVHSQSKTIEGLRDAEHSKEKYHLLADKYFELQDFEDLVKKYMEDMKKATGKDQEKPKPERTVKDAREDSVL